MPWNAYKSVIIKLKCLKDEYSSVMLFIKWSFDGQSKSLLFKNNHGLLCLLSYFSRAGIVSARKTKAFIKSFLFIAK